MKYDGVLSGDVHSDSCQCTENTLHWDKMNVKKKNRKLKYVKLRNVKSRTANWQDHGETQLQKCITSRHNWTDLWVMQSERQRSMKEEWGCKWEGKAGDEERDEEDQNKGGRGGLLGVTDGTHPDPEGRGDELWDSSELGQAGIFAQQLSVVQHLRSSCLLPIKSNPHPRTHTKSCIIDWPEYCWSRLPFSKVIVWGKVLGLDQRQVTHDCCGVND